MEICLEVQPTGIRTYKDRIAFSLSFRAEESPFFAGLASIRKIYAEALNELGYKGTFAILLPRAVHFWLTTIMSENAGHYVPIIALELRNQLRDWYNHLPSTLRFPLGTGPLFDLRKTHLSCVFLSLRVMILWPFLVRYIEMGSAKDIDESCTQQEREQLTREARECLECCRSYIHASRSLLMQKTLVTHVTLRA